MVASDAAQSGAMPMFPPPVNPSDLGRGPLVIGLTWTFTGLALIIVFVRFWIRIVVTKGLKVEDWLMLVAAFLNLACQSCLTVGFEHGFGKHDRDLYFHEMIDIAYWTWMQFTPGIVSSIVARISIAILLVRIFGIHKWLKWLVIILTIPQVVCSVVLIITTWVQVRPVEAMWNPMIPAKRLSPNVLARMGNVVGFFLALGDLCYVVFPCMVVWKLNMPRRQKAGICILLALSLFTMGCSIAKAVAAESGTKSADDKMYKTSLGLLWALAEQSFVIMMGCAPPLRSITKLPGMLSISESMKRLVSSRRSEFKSEVSNGLGQRNNGIYYELGVAGKTVSDVQADTMKSAFDDMDHPIGPGEVRRTDHFAVNNDRMGEP